MRADICALVTLDTIICIPARNIYCDASLFVSSSAARGISVCVIQECGYRDGIAFLCGNFLLNRVDKVKDFFSAFGEDHAKFFVFCIFPVFRHVHFDHVLSTCIDCCVVHVDYVFALAAVGLLCSFLHQADRFFFRNDVRQFEEGRLQDGIDPSAQTDLTADLDAVDGIKVDIVLSDISLCLSRQILTKFFCIPWAVQKEGSAILQILNHVVFTDVGRIVACHKVCLVDQISGFDLRLAETQMRNGDTAGFLGVIIEICLYILVGVIADDLDGVLVCADGSVCTQTPEFAVDDGIRNRDRIVGCVQRKIRDIIHDTDREFFLLCVLENSDDLGCLCILGAKAVASGKDRGVMELGTAKSCHHVQI